MSRKELVGTLEEAEKLCSEAYMAYFRSQKLSSVSDYNGAIEAAQHCIELSVKALFKLVGLEYPQKHDPSTKLEEVMERLDGLEDYNKVSIARAKWISKMWEWAHSTSIYGSLNVPASKLFKERDVKNAVEYASEMHNCCNIIISWVKNRQYTQFEKVEIQTAICTLDASGNWQIELKLKNSGSRASTLTNVFINDAEVSEYGANAPTGSAITTNLKDDPPSPIESGDIGTVKVWIGANYGKLSSGTTVNIKIHSAGGMDYIKLVQLV
jgi:HEPN domain-containing protein